MTEAPATTQSTAGRASRTQWRRWEWFPVLGFAAVAVPLFVLVAWSAGQTFSGVDPTPSMEPHRWLAGWTRWDSGWYERIATQGYSYAGSGQQSPVAFFPAYPLLLRLGRAAFGNVLVVGTVLTLACGLAAVLLFHRWCRERLGSRAAGTAVVVVLAYPFSWFLFGAVYSDALFLLAALGAFLLLDREKPVLAGLVGAVATAARPVGMALVVGLALRVLERRSAVRLDGRRLRFDRSRLRPADAGVLLSVLGVGSYCAYLWLRFGDALAFVSVAGAPGWEHDANLRTWLKLDLISFFRHPVNDIQHVSIAVQGVLTLAALVLVPVVVRRVGWGYGAYAFLIVFVPALSTPDFVGMGRYMLAAFPCFAVAGELLSRRSLGLRLPLLAGSSVLLASFTSLFSRWYFIS